MPDEQNIQCHRIIHAAAAAAGAAGVAPIPLSDTVPIGAAQVAMIVALGKVFDIPISESVAKAIAKTGLATTVGRAIVTSVLKAFPGAGTVVGGVVGATTAAIITEGLGWLVADDFFRMSNGQTPRNLDKAAYDVFDGLSKIK